VFRWRVLRWLIAAPALPLVVWACSAHPLEAPQPLPEQQTDQYYEVNPVREVDIVFMIDNSPSMREEQENLGRNFPAFMNELKKIEGGLPNVHIGIVSSDLGAGPNPLMGSACIRPGGDRGIFQAKPGCGLDAASKFIISSNNDTMKNFTGDISQVFSCMAQLGTDGCGFEHQLQATRVALYEGTTPENKGFLRENAFLAIILITDEDDCSADFNSNLFDLNDPVYAGTRASFRCAHTGHVCNNTQPPIMTYSAPYESCKPNDNGRLIKVQEFVDSIKALKRRPDQILVSGIFGLPNNATGALYRYGMVDTDIDFLPICDVAGQGVAYGGIRLKAFVDSFPDSAFFSICSADFTPAMRQIGEKLRARLGNPCITAPVVDTKPEPGVQPDCQVIDRVPMGAGYQDQALPQCGSGATPCWTLATDANCGQSGFKISVDRAGKLPPPGTQQAIKCLTCPKPGDPRCTR
jgi:hypothetical protein